MASVSVSHLILFVASLVIAAGVVGTVSTGVDRVSSAVDASSLDASEQLRTDVTVVSDTGAEVYNRSGNDEVTLLIKNTGTHRLAPDGSDLDVLLNGEYVPRDATAGELVTAADGATWDRSDVLRLTIDAGELTENGALDPGDYRIHVIVNGDEETFEFRVEGGS